MRRQSNDADWTVLASYRAQRVELVADADVELREKLREPSSFPVFTAPGPD